MEKLSVSAVGFDVFKEGLGRSVDTIVEPQNIEDPELAALWANAQVAMNEIQLYLEEKLGEKFFE